MDSDRRRTTHDQLTIGKFSHVIDEREFSGSLAHPTERERLASGIVEAAHSTGLAIEHPRTAASPLRHISQSCEGEWPLAPSHVQVRLEVPLGFVAPSDSAGCEHAHTRGI